MTNTHNCRRLPWLTLALGLAFSIALAGCSRSDVASVTGSVTCMGTPVTGGILIFGPIGEGLVGEPASATIKQDGTYVLTTSTGSLGALIGKHHVIFTPPPQNLTTQQRSDPDYIAPPPEYVGMAPKVADVEVKAGKNTINIELMPVQ